MGPHYPHGSSGVEPLDFERVVSGSLYIPETNTRTYRVYTKGIVGVYNTKGEWRRDKRL